MTEFQVRTAKKRLVKLTLNKTFRHGSPESTRYFIHKSGVSPDALVRPNETELSHRSGTEAAQRLKID